jgi:transcription termination/antitermination protein NusG
MTISQATALDLDTPSDLPLAQDEFEAHWYAAYTCANHEKRVRLQLEERQVESFLPVYDTMRRWKDRQKQLQLPLFPGYVFVRVALIDRLRVLKVPGVVKLVGFNGHPSPISDVEIDGLKNSLSCGVHAQPHPFLSSGRRVRIKGSPLKGLEGILIRRKGKLRVVLSIELIQRSIVVDVDVAEIEPITLRRNP